MPQFKVPQNLDMQDRIVGPLTLFQFLYLVLGFMVVYAIFRTGNIFFFTVIGLPVAIFSLALAFIKVNDQPFLKFLLSLINFIIRPKISIWHHGKTPTHIDVNQPNLAGEQKIVRKTLDQNRLQEIASKLDT